MSLWTETQKKIQKRDTKEPKKNKENEKENSVHKEARPTCMGPTPGSQDAHFGCSIKKGKPQCSFGNSPRTCLGQFKHQNTSFGIIAMLFALLLFCMPNARLATRSDLDAINSAHTALAVKACLLGGNSYTKCSITFVNIAVAISALAGGGQKRFRTETRPQKRFRTETRIRWCFRHFSRIFGCLSARGY